MEEKSSRGFSLRKKRNARPAISAPRPQVVPRQQEAPAQPGIKRPSLDAPQPRPQNNEKTSDLVKRRYSSRFANLPPGFDPTVPPVPALPSGAERFGAQAPTRQQPPGSRDGSSARAPIAVDLNALRDPNLQAEPYVKSLLADASEQDVLAYQSSLQKFRNRTSADLQQNVYQNRTQFIKISKEAERLKAEMRNLRHLMSELRANTNALSQESLGKPLPGPDADRDSIATRARKQANRSSVANLEAMWNTQLHTLWKNVEGSQKFLPAVPGRHVIRDSPHWVELNAATWKARRAIHIFLLNDHLLVASRKRKRVDPSSEAADDMAQKQQPVISKLVAEHCWPLQDIEIVDLSSKLAPGARDGRSETRGSSRAINIRAGQESYTYRHDRSESDETTGLLLAYRKAVDDLTRSMDAEVSDNLKARERSDAGGMRDGASAPKPPRPESLSANAIRDKLNLLVEVDGKQRNLRWVEAQLDELDIALALQRFGDAVDRVEQLRKVANGLRGNATVQEQISSKTDEGAEKLADTLLRQLVETQSFQKATQRHVTWLTRLGFEERAREAYLEARGSVVGKRTRQCIFEGNLPQYIFQLSYVVFTLIKNTVTVFQSCFSPVMMSACVKWAKEQVDAFNAILHRQLSTLDPGSDVWRECMERVKEHASLMTDVGMDFRNIIGPRSDGIAAFKGPGS